MEQLTTKLFKLHNISMDSALKSIEQMSKTDGLDIIVTPNMDHLERLINKNTPKEFKQLYQNASLCLCDSKILEKLLKLKGKLVREVIPGSTLTKKLFNHVITNNDQIMIIGGEDRVMNKLRSQYKHLTINHYNPPMGFINNPVEVTKTIEKIQRFDANYIFLAVGSPRQEIVASKLKALADQKGVALCIGASVLFITGEEKRAPRWLQLAHLEWLYRMLQDPKRLFPRYFNNFLKLD